MNIKWYADIIDHWYCIIIIWGWSWCGSSLNFLDHCAFSSAWWAKAGSSWGKKNTRRANFHQVNYEQGSSGGTYPVHTLLFWNIGYWSLPWIMAASSSSSGVSPRYRPDNVCGVVCEKSSVVRQLSRFQYVLTFFSNHTDLELQIMAEKGAWMMTDGGRWWSIAWTTKQIKQIYEAILFRTLSTLCCNWFVRNFVTCARNSSQLSSKCAAVKGS